LAKFRHISRVVAFQALFSITHNFKADQEDIFKYICFELAPSLKDQAFAKELFFGVLKNRKILDERLQKIAPRWPINKLSLVERCVLEIGAFEMIFKLETPTAVILNEAIEIAKEFGDGTAGKFINGVLSSLGKENRNDLKK